jgi:hypothetical protein
MLYDTRCHHGRSPLCQALIRFLFMAFTSMRHISDGPPVMQKRVPLESTGMAFFPLARQDITIFGCFKKLPDRLCGLVVRVPGC